MASLRLTHLSSGTAVYLPGEHFGPRTLGDFEMVWITAGSARYRADRQTVDASPGSMILARPGFRERYAWDEHTVSRHAYFHFGADAWPDDWPATDTWPIHRATAGDDVCRALFDHVLRLNARRIDANEPIGPELCRQVEALVSAFLLGDAAAQGADAEGTAVLPPAVLRAMDWTRALLRELPDAAVDLDALADAAKVSPKHLCRLFGQAVGRPPMRWVMDTRLTQAQTLLRRSNLNVQQVAHRCGFASPFHFSRAYKQRFGRPPSADRARS